MKIAFLVGEIDGCPHFLAFSDATGGEESVRQALKKLGKMAAEHTRGKTY
ncbi:MAG: hypothetical protein ACTIM4_12815 [Marinomonas sp.]